MSEIQSNGGTSAIGFINEVISNKVETVGSSPFINELTLALDKVFSSGEASINGKKSDESIAKKFDDGIELPEIPGFININVIGLSPEAKELTQQDIDNLLSNFEQVNFSPAIKFSKTDSLSPQQVDNNEQVAEYSPIKISKNTEKSGLKINLSKNENISEKNIIPESPKFDNVNNTEKPTIPQIVSNSFTKEISDFIGFRQPQITKNQISNTTTVKKGKEIDLNSNVILENNIDIKMENISSDVTLMKEEPESDNSFSFGKNIEKKSNSLSDFLENPIQVNDKGEIKVSLNTREFSTISDAVINPKAFSKESNIIDDLKEFNRIISKENNRLTNLSINEELLPKKIKSGFNEFRKNVIDTNNELINFSNRLINKNIKDLTIDSKITSEVITDIEKNSIPKFDNKLINDSPLEYNDFQVEIVDNKGTDSAIKSKNDNNIEENISSKVNPEINLNKSINAEIVKVVQHNNKPMKDSDTSNSTNIISNTEDKKIETENKNIQFRDLNDSNISDDKHTKNSFSSDNQTPDKSEDNQILTKKIDFAIKNDGELSTTVQNEPIKSEVKEVKIDNNTQINTVTTKISNHGTDIVKKSEVTEFTLVKRITPDDFPSTGIQLIKSLPENGSGNAKLILQPQALGTIIVEIKMTQNKMRMEVKADSQETVKLIESQLGNLKEKLAVNGIITEKIDVSLNQENLQNFGSAGQFQRQGKREDKTARNAFVQSLTGSGTTDTQEAEPSSTKRNFSKQGSLIEKYI